MQVTDFLWYDERRHLPRKGYYMDQMLATNLFGVTRYLDKAWDVVGIISGHGKVRIGKSTVAQQVGYFMAWLIAGGLMEKDETTERYYVSRSPQRAVHFGIENIVFTPEDLMKKAELLFKKYGRNQVIIYDEGRAGLDSARAMESINKAMVDFFQQCGQYGHVILIVLPNFFKLHEDYAVSRSLFLIDAYTDDKLNRGFFRFYNEIQKEYLYNIGKKKVGNTIKYMSSYPSFSGRFTDFLPVNKKEYEEAKAAAIKLIQGKKTEVRWKKERDAAIYLIKRQTEWTVDAIAREMTVVSQGVVSARSVANAIKNITHEEDIA